MAAPRSCGGRAGPIHGGVQCAASTDSVASQYAIGPVYPNAPPSAAADSRPVPVIPARLRSKARVPPGRTPPTAPAASAPNAVAVSATAAARRSQGSHRPGARSGGPDGAGGGTGTRRLSRYSHASRSEATAGRAASGAGTAPGGELWTLAAVMAAVPG